MTYKRPEDQYRIQRSKEMIQQLKDEEEKAKVICPFSTVRPYRKIDFQGVPHAGNIVHRCSLEKGHEGNCKCVDPCGVEFKGF